MSTWPRTLWPAKSTPLASAGPGRSTGWSGLEHRAASRARGRSWTEQYPPLDLRTDAARTLLAAIDQAWRDGTAVVITHPAHRVPLGAAGGAPTVNGASQSGTSLVTQGWSGANPVLRRGDLVSVTGVPYVLRVTADVSHTAGAATLPLDPPIAAALAPAHGAAVAVTGVTFRAMIASAVVPPADEDQFVRGVAVTFMESLEGAGGGGGSIVIPPTLTVTTQPGGAVDGVAFTQQPVLQVTPPVVGVVVTVSITAGAGSLVGAATATTNGAGVATFAGLGIDATTPPSSFTLLFSAPGYSSVASNPINVSEAGGAYGPGPNAPAGLAAVWPAFDGSLVPQVNDSAARNAFGMYSYNGQNLTLTKVNTAEQGDVLRVGFPAYNDPLAATVWPPDYGGQAPSSFMMQDLLDAGGRKWRTLYLRVRLRVSSNWTQYGVVPPSGPAYAWNAGTKFFFPKLTGRLQGSGSQAGLPWSRDVVDSLADNHFVGLFQAFYGVQPEGIRTVAALQQNRIWDGTTVDGQGYPVWDYGGTFGAYPDPAEHDGLALGVFHDIEFEFVMNTVGQANGQFRCWQNGTLKHQATNIRWAPTWVPYRPAGHNADVALAVSEPRWSYVFCRSTFGGGSALPPQNAYYDIADLYIAGKD